MIGSESMGRGGMIGPSTEGWYDNRDGGGGMFGHREGE